MVATKLMTAEEFAALPDDGWRWELIEGVPVRMPPPGFEHGQVGSDLLLALRLHVDPRHLGVVLAGVGFLFERDPDQVRAPDVSFIRAERLPPRSARRGYLTVPPDLAVEVVSPSDRPTDVADKTAFYLAHDVAVVWEVDPTPPHVAVHRPGGPPVILGPADTLEGEGPLAGFRLPLGGLFSS